MVDAFTVTEIDVVVLDEPGDLLQDGDEILLCPSHHLFDRGPRRESIVPDHQKWLVRVIAGRFLRRGLPAGSPPRQQQSGRRASSNEHRPAIDRRRSCCLRDTGPVFDP